RQYSGHRSRARVADGAPIDDCSFAGRGHGPDQRRAVGLQSVRLKTDDRPVLKTGRKIRSGTPGGRSVRRSDTGSSVTARIEETDMSAVQTIAAELSERP